MSIRSLAKEFLIKQQNRQYVKRLADKKGSYDRWIAAHKEFTPEWVSLQESASEPVQNAREGLVYVISSKGSWAQGARESFRRYFAENPHCQMAYGDEDVWPVGQERRDPWFKPDWSPDLLDSFLYFGSVVALRRELWDRVRSLWEETGGQGANLDWMEELSAAKEEGGRVYRVVRGADAWTQYERWLHHCAELSGAYITGRKSVGHIRQILFHSDHRREQEKFLERTALSEQRAEAVFREFRDGYCLLEDKKPMPGEVSPVVSVIIPSKDHADILEACLRGCKAAGTKGLPCEILIVDNGSSEENKRRIENLTKEMEDAWWTIRYLYRPMEFHFSRMCNLGAAKAQGNFLLFLNDDVELCEPECILRMAALADREYTGAVGLKLFYPDTQKIQHAGITNLPMGPVHKLQFLDDNKCYYYNANRGRRNVLAVTAACLMIEREKFHRAGGFAEELRVAFNDVDLGFALYELGYHNVCMNDCYAYHHESLSRGDDESFEKLNRLLAERDILYKRHPNLEGTDPYYSEGMGREGLDVRIRPAWETEGNVLQEVVGRLEECDQKRLRPDNCLLLRVEQSRNGIVQGYGVVLGDNNACYEYKLLLRQSEERTYEVSLIGQYRPDLEENMPDQVNVGLCGFHIRLTGENIDPGRYRIGLAAYSKVSGLKLMNFSERFLEV
ncbi:MAG: glycosyltransferase [Candidatus Gastranaerophilales bacterium]|nr:glycosyltransferase [Candidatus Gastranaerophilales bacterium]